MSIPAQIAQLELLLRLYLMRKKSKEDESEETAHQYR